MTQTRMKATSGAQPQMCSGTAALSLWASPPTALHNWVQVTAQVVPLWPGWAGPNPAIPCITKCLHYRVPPSLLATATATGIKGMFRSGQAVSGGAGWQHAGDTVQQGGLAGTQAPPWPVALHTLRHHRGNWGLALPQAWDVSPRAEPPLLQPPCSSSNAASRISSNFYF